MPHQEAAIIRLADDRPSTRHFVGGVPGSSGNDGRISLPWPRIALIVQRPDGIFLERFTEGGAPSGDTWHMSIDDAKEQAEREYGHLLGPWHKLPDQLEDELLLDYIRETFSGR
jgi:hypothetical protein